MFYFASRGFRCIAHDRRGHGRSSQPWNGNDMDTYADDLAKLTEALDLKDTMHVGHSTGGGEVARYIGRHGTKRVAQGRADRRGTATDAPDDGQSRRLADGRVRPDTRRRPCRSVAVLEGSQHAVLWLQQAGRKSFRGHARILLAPGDDGGLSCSYFCIKAFSETDLTEDLKKFDMPTLIMHGDDDQIVPIGASAMLSSKLFKNSQLKIYKGGSHGICQTQKNEVNQDLFAFLKV